MRRGIIGVNGFFAQHSLAVSTRRATVRCCGESLLPLDRVSPQTRGPGHLIGV